MDIYDMQIPIHVLIISDLYLQYVNMIPLLNQPINPGFGIATLSLLSAHSSALLVGMVW